MVEQVVDDASEDSGTPQPTPSTGSDVGDFEMVSSLAESLDKAKTTGAQVQGGGKKRKGKKK